MEQQGLILVGRICHGCRDYGTGVQVGGGQKSGEGEDEYGDGHEGNPRNYHEQGARGPRGVLRHPLCTTSGLDDTSFF